MSTSNFDLNKRARDLWAAWLQAALERRGSSQKAIAIEIDQQDGSSARSDVSRFVTGKEGALRAWFTVHLDRLNILARHTGLTVDELRAKLAALQRGELEPEVGWHPAFPELRLADVEIPAALEGERGESLERVIDVALQRLGDANRWTKDLKPEKIGLIGAPGRSREIAAQQVQVTLQRRLDALRAEGGPRQAQAARSRRGAPAEKMEIPHITVEVVAAPAPQEAAPCVLRVLVMDEDQSRETPNFAFLRLRMLPWGPSQATALATRLAELTPAAQAVALRAFAARVDATPAMVGADATPDLVIRLLAEVARRGCPGSVPEARDLLARAAWEKALVRGGDVLRPFDQRLMDRLMAALAVRPRTRPEDVRSWTWVPRPVVLEALRAAMVTLLGPAAGRPLAALVAEAKQAKGRGRQPAFEALELTLASEPAVDVLDALICGGVFAEEPRYTGVLLRIVEPTVAAIWAARSLSELPPFDPEWQRLLDPDWLIVLDELARRGLRTDALQARLEGHPEELVLDAASWMVRFALVSVDPIPVDLLLPAWATMVWAEAHGMYTALMAWQRSPWGDWLPRVLRRISDRYRDVLPVFHKDPVEEVRAQVPELVRQLVGRWRHTPGPEKTEEIPAQSWGLLSFGELRDRDALRYHVCTLCPDQVVPTEGWSMDWWEGQSVERGVVRLIERAKTGDDRAASLLDGRAWLAAREEPQTVEPAPRGNRRSAPLAVRIWHHVPAPTLLRWVGAAAHVGRDASLLLQEIVRRLKSEQQTAAQAELLALAVRAGTEEMERLCERSLLRDDNWYRPFDSELAMRIAGHLRLTDLLWQVVRQPMELLPESRLRVRDARVSIEPGWWIFPLQVAIERQCGRTLGVHIELTEILDALERDAHQAAVELYRLGVREPLRERWIRGPDYLVNMPIWRDLARAEGLFSLLACGFPSPYFRADDLLCLGEGRPADSSAVPSDFARFALVQQDDGRTWPALPALLHNLTSLQSALRPEVLAIADGVVALLTELPDELPAQIERLLTSGPRMHVASSVYGGLHLYECWRRLAERALLDLGDDMPLHAWARAGGGRHDSAERDQPITWGVSEWMGEDEARLERLWNVVQMEGKAERLTGERLLETEWLLLASGSARPGKAGDPSALSGAAPRPQPFVIAEALRTKDSERWMRLHDFNSHHRDWVPVIRRALQQGPDPRTHAALAFDLAQHEPDSPELVRAIRHWALMDADPFLGGPHFDWRGGRAVGGVENLLTALARRTEPWATEGLLRLWQIALRLPITSTRPTYTTGSWDEDRPAERMVLVSNWAECPTPLGELARALEARGRTDEILRAWDNPPVEPAPEMESTGDRPAMLRQWLRPWWLRLASSAALHGQLMADPVRFPMDVVQELIRRRSPGLEEFAAHLARVTDYYVLGPLLEADPGAAVQVVTDRAARPVAPIRIELAGAMERAGSRWFQHLGVLRLLRAHVGELEPEGTARASSQGLRDA